MNAHSVSKFQWLNKNNCQNAVLVYPITLNAFVFTKLYRDSCSQQGRNSIVISSHQFAFKQDGNMKNKPFWFDWN